MKKQLLSPDSTHTFKCDLLPNMVRTGTIADGSCFFHALFFAISHEYRHMEVNERHSYIQQERKRIATATTLVDFKNVGSGNLYRMFITIVLSKLIKDEEVLNRINNHWDSTNIYDISQYNTTLPISLSKLQEIEKHVFELWKSSLENDWVDETFIELLQNYYRLNFVFIHSDTRKLYRTTHCYPYDTFVCFLWIDNGHYESLGQLQPNRKIRRKFTKSDLQFLLT